MTPSQAAIHRASKRRSAVTASMNVWPLLALEIFILCIFMTTLTNFHQGIGVDRPKSHNPSPQPAGTRFDSMHIRIVRDGKIFFGNTNVSSDQLSSRIASTRAAGSENKIYVDADARAKLSDVELVFDQIRAASVAQVAILTDPLIH